MKNILIVDTETTSTAPDRSTIEVCAALYSVEWRSVVSMVSSVCLDRYGNPAEAVNGIPSGLVASGGFNHAWPVWEMLFEQLWALSDAVVAHFAEFDRPNIEGIKTLELDPLPISEPCILRV